MNQKFVIVLCIIFISSLIYSQNTKDTFSLVLIKDNDFLSMYKSSDSTFEEVGKIPYGTTGIKTTWKTVNNENNPWIEIIYNDKKGWVKREYLTRAFGKYGKKEKDKTIDLLINLTKSLQQEDPLSFKELFYSLRGFSVFDTNSKILKTFTYKDINRLWLGITDNKKITSNNNFKKIFADILKILESDFIIEYNHDPAKNKNFPVEITNFEYVLLKCKYDPRLSNITLYIGIEFWNNKPFISSIITAYQ